MKKITSILGSLILCGVAYAAVPGSGIPALFITSPVGNEQINVYGVGPQIETIYLSQARDSSGYQAITEGATNVLTVSNNVSVLAFHGATAGTAMITTPATPFDGERLLIFSTAGITTLTLTANTGQTIDNNTTVLAANAHVEYIYQLSTLTWFRIQ
jgi:hypothetical protein